MFLISSTIKLYWKFDFSWICMTESEFLKNQKNSKIFMNFEVTNFNFFLETSFTRNLSPQKIEVDNFIVLEQILFFPNFFSSFWAIPPFFAHFEQLFFWKMGSRGVWSWRLQKTIFWKKLQSKWISPAKSFGHTSNIHFGNWKTKRLRFLTQHGSCMKF